MWYQLEENFKFDWNILYGTWPWRSHKSQIPVMLLATKRNNYEYTKGRLSITLNFPGSDSSITLSTPGQQQLVRHPSWVSNFKAFCNGSFTLEKLLNKEKILKEAMLGVSYCMLLSGRQGVWKTSWRTHFIDGTIESIESCFFDWIWLRFCRSNNWDYDVISLIFQECWEIYWTLCQVKSIISPNSTNRIDGKFK